MVAELDLESGVSGKYLAQNKMFKIVSQCNLVMIFQIYVWLYSSNANPGLPNYIRNKKEYIIVPSSQVS